MALKKDKTRYLLLSPSAALDTLAKKSLFSYAIPDFSGTDIPGQIRTDSRQVLSGDIFIAYKGVASDGHAYLKAAVDNGAALLIVEDLAAAAGLNVPCVEVKNGREAWAFLAAQAAGNPQDSLEAVGVTGTNGKTSTTWVVTHMLEKMGVPTLLVGTTGAKLGNKNFPTRLTTPDPSDLYPLLAQAVEMGAKVVAMEVSSHAIRQKKLVPIAFSCAVFTSFSRDHLDFHKTMDDYWDAKWELFTKMLTKDAHAIVCNQVVPPQPLSSGLSARVFSYGTNIRYEDKDYQPLLAAMEPISVTITNSSFSGSDASIDLGNETRRGRIPYIGGHAVENFVAALLCARKVTGVISDSTIWTDLPDIPGRLERVSHHHGPAVIVDYAHTPDALEKTLRLLRPLTHGKLICLFGCGGDRDIGKRPEMGKVAETFADTLFVTSDNPRTEEPESILADIRAGLGHPNRAFFETDRAKAIKMAIESACMEDIVCIAGKGHETYQIIGDRKIDFDDRLIAAAFLRERKA